VRSRTNRNIRVKDASGRWRKRKLHHWAGKLPTLGERTVVVDGHWNQIAREARVRDLSRKNDGRPARAVVDEPYIEALSLWRWKEARMDLSAKDFLYALARLGGHLGRKADRLPGWLVLWRGWMELQRLAEGMLLGRLKRSG